MAYRQYIGARYVPLYAGTWDATKNYEPLTIVDDANGNSYTSKKDVPAGTPLTDRAYWIQTSSFSGAVEQLRRDVTTLQENTSDLQTGVSEIGAIVNSLSGDVASIEREVEVLTLPRKVLIVADSYGDYADAQGRYINQIIAQDFGISCDMVHLTSIGFKTSPNNFATVLSTYTGNKNEITDILIVGGANDIIKNDQSLEDGANQVKQQLATFPNLKSYACFACGVSMYGLVGTTAGQWNVHLREYLKDLPRFGIPVVENSPYVLLNTELLRDNVHPNSDGLSVLAGAIFNYLNGAGIDVLYSILVTPAGASSGASVTSYIMTRKNGVVTIDSPGKVLPFRFVFPPNTVVPANGTVPALVLATYSNTLVDLTGYASYLPANFVYSDNSVNAGVIAVILTNGNISIQAIGALAGKTISSGYITGDHHVI